MEILSFLLQTIGSAVITVVALLSLAPTKLGEKFLDYRFERKLSAMKHEHNSQIEELKALLARASRVHEKQEEALNKLYDCCCNANGYLQRIV